LIQCRDRPDSYREPRRFKTIPSRPSVHTEVLAQSQTRADALNEPDVSATLRVSIGSRRRSGWWALWRRRSSVGAARKR
jgi:hypothetical protein